MDLVEIPQDGRFARHPWELARFQFFDGVLSPVLGSGASTLLDAGSGDAWLARRLAASHPDLTVTCFDPGYEAEGVLERLPQVERVSYTASEPPGPFDVLTLLDVLEHVDDDAALLGSLAERIRPDGRVLISVPAWPRLFSRHDAALLHFRRYTPEALAGLVGRVGLVPISRGGLFHSLLVPRAAAVSLEHLRSQDGGEGAPPEHRLEWRGGKLARRLVESILGGDTEVSRVAAQRGLQLPGLSCWMLCRRP